VGRTLNSALPHAAAQGQRHRNYSALRKKSSSRDRQAVNSSA